MQCLSSSSINEKFHVQDLMTNPLIVPVKILRSHEMKDFRGVLDCAFHPKQPWIFTAGGDCVVSLFTNWWMLVNWLRLVLSHWIFWRIDVIMSSKWLICLDLKSLSLVKSHQLKKFSSPCCSWLIAVWPSWAGNKVKWWCVYAWMNHAYGSLLKFTSQYTHVLLHWLRGSSLKPMEDSLCKMATKSINIPQA